jgi:hypothetical protein
MANTALSACIHCVMERSVINQCEKCDLMRKSIIHQRFNSVWKWVSQRRRRRRCSTQRKGNRKQISSSSDNGPIGQTINNSYEPGEWQQQNGTRRSSDNRTHKLKSGICVFCAHNFSLTLSLFFQNGKSTLFKD